MAEDEYRLSSARGDTGPLTSDHQGEIMTRFFKVQMGAEGWGLLVNEGTANEPKFRILLKGTELWMDRMAAHLNEGRASNVEGLTDEDGKLLDLFQADPTD